MHAPPPSRRSPPVPKTKPIVRSDPIAYSTPLKKEVSLGDLEKVRDDLFQPTHSVIRSNSLAFALRIHRRLSRYTPS